MLLENYYQEYNEDIRLFKDKVHNIEFITTIKYLEKFINEKTVVLDNGCGTGVYATHFFKTAKKIYAVDIIPKHIKQLTKKINQYNIKNVIADIGDALNLSMFEDNSFDVVLCLGPMYHFNTENEKRKCIEEIVRTTKNGGIVAIAYINQFATFVSESLKNRKLMPNEELIENIFVRKSMAPFSMTNVKEIEALLSNYGIDKIYNIGTDGISYILKDIVNDFNEDKFNIWLKYHLDSCEDESIIGYSSHGLYIGELRK